MSKNYNLIGIFQTPIIKIKFKDYCKYNFPEVEKKDNKPDSWIDSVNTSFPFIEPDDPVVSPMIKKNLMADLKSSIVEVFEELNMPTNIDFTEFWYNIYHDNQGQERHNHLSWIGSKNLYWCGIYYHKNASPTTFYREPGRYELQRWPDYMDSAMDSVLSAEYFPFVDDGDIILFPPYLDHSVKSKQKPKDEMRMTFSFNIDVLSLNVNGSEILV